IPWTRFGAVLVVVTAVVVGALGATQATAVVSLWRGRSGGAGEVHDPPSRGRRHTAWALPAAGGLTLVGALYLLLPWADLRPVSLLDPDTLSRRQELTERGRSLLERSAHAHGLEAISRKKTATIVATDEWPGGSPWWPVPAQRFEAVRRLGTFTSQVELLEGPRAGEIHGLQSWQPYRRPPGATSVEPVDSSPLASFYLPTLQYFDELPFRLLEAPIVVDAGPKELGSKTFDRLFVTWGDEAPHARDDQYEIWIDPDTHRIAKAYYTVREAPAFSPALLAPLMRFAGVGTMHYSDYRDVEGVLMPFVQTVTLGSPEDHPSEAPGEFFHRLTVESIRFDAADPASLEVLSGLAPPAAHKLRLDAPGRP
ncbi:MAG: hypothetical protein R3244_07765, partial [Thermoanaerobaculia bacterium]|nr:hypothetical protein [Thermoanaerobaculia bacterium]